MQQNETVRSSGFVAVCKQQIESDQRFDALGEGAAELLPHLVFGIFTAGAGGPDPGR